MVMIFIVTVRSQAILLVVSVVPRDPLSGGDSMGSRTTGRRVCVLDALLREVHSAIFLGSSGHFVEAPHDGVSAMLNCFSAPRTRLNAGRIRVLGAIWSGGAERRAQVDDEFKS
jgi:hypothetical protein